MVYLLLKRADDNNDLMTATYEDNFVSRGKGELRNSSERVIAIIRE
jgi:hypothetical protein